jgi:hypothetical protein
MQRRGAGRAAVSDFDSPWKEALDRYFEACLAFFFPLAHADIDPWKEALDRYFEACLAFFFPQAHADIDWARGHEMLDKELQKVVPQAEQGRRVVDKLVKVWLKGGQETWLLIHIEVQSWREGAFAKRMHVYNYRLFDRYLFFPRPPESYAARSSNFSASSRNL